jgi:uncharacterized protein (TIGR00369 family)
VSDTPTHLGPYNGFGFEIPFVLSLGIELHEFADGASLLRFAPEPSHLNSFEVVHGGALMTLLDVTLATAARSVAPDNGIVTIEMKTSFMQPAKGPLTGRGRLIHRTKSLAFTEGTVFNAEGQACVHATGTFRYVRRDQGQPQSHKPPTD